LQILGLFAIVLLFFQSCSAPDPKDVQSDTVSTETYVECEQASPLVNTPKLTDSFQADDSLELQAATTPGYNDQIKNLVNSSCAVAGCHVAGSVFPDLSNYASAKANMARSKIRIEQASSPMPPGGQLEADYRSLFAAWVNAGGPESENASETTNPTPTTTPTPSATPTPVVAPTCFVKNEKRTATEDTEFEYLLKTNDVKDCHSKNLIYDRNAKACGTAILSLDWCTRIGILKKFAESEKDVLAVVNKALGDGTKTDDIGDGFVIDQCGLEPSGAPIAIFIRLVKPPEVPGLKVRVLSIDKAKKDGEVSAPETTPE
jgi:hypothetical protein